MTMELDELREADLCAVVESIGQHNADNYSSSAEETLVVAAYQAQQTALVATALEKVVVTLERISDHLENTLNTLDKIEHSGR